MNFETFLNYFILFIIFVKIIYSIAYFGHIFFMWSDENTHIFDGIIHINNIDDKYGIDNWLLYLKKRTEFIFIICMSMLLIYHFHPKFSNIPISQNTKMLFLFFGIILLFSADWTVFFDKDSLFVKIIDKIK